MKKNILITGGAGYIGSHTCIELIRSNYKIIILDNFSNSNKNSIKAIEKLSNSSFTLYEGDINNKDLLFKIFSENNISAVIHFAALKSISESVENPLFYYENNISGTLTLLNVVEEFNCKNIIFSSSATVYGKPKIVPIKEDETISAINPYGRTKLFIENILNDLYRSDKKWNIVILRYFNPIGAHESGELGESPNGIPNNLLPYVTLVASGKLPFLGIYGNDYETIDGTGVRDYIHVVDLAKGHVAALKNIETNKGYSVYNLGTGKGYSVLQIVEIMKKVTGKDIPYKILPRRDGDIDICYADPAKALKELNWQAEFDLEKMCLDAWRWQQKYPNGFLK